MSRLRFPSLLLPDLIWINPEHIKKFSSVNVKPNKGCHIFHGGDWDLNSQTYEEISKHPKYITCRQLVIQNTPIEKTEEFHWILCMIKKNGSYNGMRDRSGVVEALQKRKQFYREVTKCGIKSQAELGFSPWTGGIQAGVDRCGDLVRINAGHHRYAISRLLSFPLIPIQVAILHESLIANFNFGHAIKRVNKVRDLIKELEIKYR